MCLDSLVLRVRYWDAGIATRSYVTFYSIKRRLSMRIWSRGRQFKSFTIAVRRWKCKYNFYTPTWQPSFGRLPLSVYQWQCVCVYSNSRNDVPRVAQRYGTIAAHTRRRASVLVMLVVFLRAHVQCCRFDKADATADVQ